MTLERRTPLRRTPFRRKAVRKPSTAGSVTKIREVPKRARSKGDFSPKAKKEVRRRSMGWCELPGCTRSAAHFHHRLMRSHSGPGIASNALHCCEHCHTYIHANPKLSYENGWLIRSGAAQDVG